MSKNMLKFFELWLKLACFRIKSPTAEVSTLSGNIFELYLLRCMIRVVPFKVHDLSCTFQGAWIQKKYTKPLFNKWLE